MNDNTTRLIQELAKKLGTTSEYLWFVLLKQAPFSATISSIFVLSTIVLGIILLKLHIKFSKEEDKTGYKESRYEKNEFLVIPMIIGVVLFIIFSVTSVCELPSILSGYFNPEYWALEEVMDKIK